MLDATTASPSLLTALNPCPVRSPAMKGVAVSLPLVGGTTVMYCTRLFTDGRVQARRHIPLVLEH